MKTEPKKITHHPADPKLMRARMQQDIRSVAEYKASLGKHPQLLSSLAEESLNLALYKLLLDKDQTGFWEHIRIAHLARTWHWKGLVTRGPHKVTLPGIGSFTFQDIPANIDVNPYSFLGGVYLAFVLRDQAALDVYRAVPPQTIRLDKAVPLEPFLREWLKFLCIVGTDTQNIRASFERVPQHIATVSHTSVPPTWKDYIYAPVTALWKHILDNNPDHFSNAMQSQQEKRKAFHSVKDNDRCNQIRGYYCLSALAAVCYAYDLGFPISVVSDYLPDFLIRQEVPRLQWPAVNWRDLSGISSESGDKTIFLPIDSGIIFDNMD